MEIAKFAARALIAAYLLYLFGEALFYGDKVNEPFAAALLSLTAGAVGYWIGSSQGSADKSKALENKP